MTIGEISLQCGLPASTIRYYEQIGLIPRARRQAGRRDYDRSIFDRLDFISFTRHAGFTLAEIRLLTAASDREKPISAKVRQVATSRIAVLEQQMRRMQEMRELLAGY